LSATPHAISQTRKTIDCFSSPEGDPALHLSSFVAQLHTDGNSTEAFPMLADWMMKLLPQNGKILWISVCIFVERQSLFDCSSIGLRNCSMACADSWLTSASFVGNSHLTRRQALLCFEPANVDVRPTATLERPVCPDNFSRLKANTDFMSDTSAAELVGEPNFGDGKAINLTNRTIISIKCDFCRPVVVGSAWTRFEAIGPNDPQKQSKWSMTCESKQLVVASKHNTLHKHATFPCCAAIASRTGQTHLCKVFLSQPSSEHTTSSGAKIFNKSIVPTKETMRANRNVDASNPVHQTPHALIFGGRNHQSRAGAHKNSGNPATNHQDAHMLKTGADSTAGLDG